MSKQSIGDRMKNNYELVWKQYLPLRMPLVIRLDGKAFHTWTRKMDRPFDDTFISWMGEVVLELCKEVEGCQIAYHQSDEISLLLHNYKKLDTQPWFGNELQKITSVSASIASAKMTQISGRIAHFDARVFVLPEAEVNNYFVFRQQDASRNSIQMLAQSLYSQKQLHKKNTQDLHDLIHEKGLNWNDVETHKKRGMCGVRDGFGWKIDKEIPIFSQDKSYIEKLLEVEE